MIQATQCARKNNCLAQLFVVGNLLFGLLINAGIAHSFITNGRLPELRVGYADAHQQLIKTERQADVISELRTAASINFDDGVTQLQLLSMAYKARDTESIILGLRGLLNHAPDDSELHGELAIVLLRIGRLEDALIHSRMAVKFNPDSARLHVTQGAVMLAMARNLEAAASYRKALELDPNSESAQRALEHPLKNY
jgi:protein O-GlcNAc transferase